MCHLLFDHFQFTLIHGLTILGSYAILFTASQFTTSPVISPGGCCSCFGSISSFFLELFLHWSPVAHWAPNDLGSSSFSVLSFCLFILFMGSQGKNTEVVCHSLLQRTTICQNCPPWLVSLGWPYMAWLIVSLSYTKLWSMWSIWLVFCDSGFHSLCPLMEKDKRLMEASSLKTLNCEGNSHVLMEDKVSGN